MRRILLTAVMCSLFAMPLQAQRAFLNHITAEAGAGFSFPSGNVANRTSTGFMFMASGGPRFNRHFTLSLDFSLHYLGLEDSFIVPETGAEILPGSELRVWTLTVNPGYEFIKQERFSAYATGGFGLYNRRLLITTPGLVPAAVCDDFWNVCITNQPDLSSTGHGSLYKGGYNVGGGVTFGARTKFFVEARYHHMLVENPTLNLIPLTFGVRW